MTKEIIIDGVNVSECYGYVHNAKEYDCGETYSKFHHRFCKENPNCNFKQRKRAERKLEKIKEYLNSCNLKADFTACEILQIIEGE